ncbi:retrovirus-related pol polyprotein from transposon TNT 1-94 [Tanacetum coccineum]
MLTRSMTAKLTAASANECLFADFLFEIEPKKVSETLKHPGWINSLQEELNQFYRNKEEGIDYDETIRILFAFATYMSFKVYQMDVKSAFLNGKLKEEVYVKQPPGFESSEFPDYVCKLNKALHGLKQAPRVWYETISNFLIQNKFTRGRIDNTLFIYKSKGDVLLVQVYVDAVIFGSTSYKLCKQFERLMTKKFEISMIGELTYFLGLQIKHDDKGISIYQEQYTRNLLKKYKISDSSPVKTPMVPPNNLGHDLAGKLVNETSYRAGKPVNKTSYRGMIGSLIYLTATRSDIQFSTVLCARYQSNLKESHLTDVKRVLRCLSNTWWKLVCWSAKKQQSVAMSSAEAEYVTVAWCCAKQQTIKYAPQWNNITVNNVTFQTNNVLLPTVPQWSIRTSTWSFRALILLMTLFHQLVLGGNYSSIEQVNSIQQLLAYRLITGTEVDTWEIIYSDLITKLLNKSRLSYPRFISCALQVLLGSDYTQDENFVFFPGILSNSNFTKDPSKVRTGAKYQPDTEPLQLQTFADVQAFLLSEDELDKDSDEEEVLLLGRTWMRILKLLKKFELHHQIKTSLNHLVFKNLLLTHPEQHKEATVSYADLKASIEEYYDENVAHIDQTDKLVETTMCTIDKGSIAIKDLYRGLNVITKLLKNINNAVKDDPATNKKIDEAIETFAKISTNTIEAHALKQEETSAAWAKSSTNMAWNLGSRMTAIEISQTALKSKVSSHRQDTSEIKSMMTKIYQAFKGQSSSTPSSSVTPTLALTNIPANVEGENATNTATEEPSSHTEGETKDPKMAIPISSIQPTESDEDPSKKLVPASTIVRPDLDEEVKVPYMINGKMYYLTDTEMQAYLDKEEKLKKAVEEARILAISKPGVIKVVQEEAKKIGLDPKKIASVKPCEKFKKAQDVEHQKIPEELGIQSALPTQVPKQASSQTSGRKRKHMELEPKVKVYGLECDRSLPGGVPFVNNMVIEEPEYGIFFTDVFGDQAFQR